ncbi:fibronectin type III domain-containing protein [Streptomyces sp. NPDC015130]|uniref:extracellular catalytic domain type 2 short-chain-length polyhydroxyalkanoate depolymerase n=1 Tax=Streptomyces sp. NPDC015130 TaxID=3364940 RepID=UPI0037004651
MKFGQLRFGQLKVGRLLVAGLAAVGLAATTVGGATAAVPTPTPGALQQYDISATYVSGLSSGGFMANQLHVAYSDVFEGAGIFSAGPYDCAQNSVSTAQYACMDTFMPRKTPAQLEQLTRDRAATGKVDAVANLAGDKVWLFHGTNDTTVKAAVNDDLASYYRDFGANVVYDNTSAAGHAWVSPLGPNSCSSTSSPYVNNCGGDPVRGMLTHLLGGVNAASTSALTGKLVRFDQSAYAPGGNAGAISMGNEGFAYVPQSCQSGASCKLMVTLHGCYQYFGVVGNALMDKAYLNEYADTNDMIVLYPQATTMTGNPRGCWDWWGYKSADYAQKSGPQMTAVTNMARALGAGSANPPAGLPAPTGLTATATTETSASLSWNAVAGAASYDVYRDGTKVNSAPVTSTTYTDTALTAATTYSYAVAAVDAAGTVGTRSGTVNATTTGSSPVCVTASNYAHTQAGRAHQSGGYAYANGSNQNLGLWNVLASSTLKETAPGYWVKC